MLNVVRLPIGIYMTNCYILWQEGNDHCLVIDPADKPEAILAACQKKNLTIDAILLTHGHFDHVGGVRTLAAEYPDCPVYLCPEDLIMPPQMTAGPLYYNIAYHDGAKLDLAGITWQVMETPGHTPGSVCLLAEDCIFSGDTLFKGSCGRTDLPCGDYQAITASLHRISQIPGNYRVFPGHGDSTTLADEKLYNPFLK